MEVTAFLSELCKGISIILEYIKSNSIDFIAIIASVVIAIQTDKWIGRRKDREQKKYILEELPKEIEQLLESLENDERINNDNICCDKLVLKIYPYETPLWESVKNTERIDLIVGCRGYKEILQFYDSISQLNGWENLLTSFILFSGPETKYTYQEALLMQIMEQRKKCISLARNVRDRLREER